MERLMRSLSLRRRKDSSNSESSKPYLWLDDERRVRDGNCSFHVKYLGCTEVFESRGIQVCEEAIAILRNTKVKCPRAMLYVSGDALRVVDELSKGLVLDQTIEKVSFCAPDRNNDRGFAYICRDGTTRRWICHGFMSTKDSGERLSHAVGCAFTICLERKQQREKERAATTFIHNVNDVTNNLQRTGTFRQTSLVDRLTDPQSAMVAEPVPTAKSVNLFAVERPHAPVDLLCKQGSFRALDKLTANSSPFKRQLSLQLTHNNTTQHRQDTVSPITEASPATETQNCLGYVCQQLAGFSVFSPTSPVAHLPGSNHGNNVVLWQPVAMTTRLVNNRVETLAEKENIVRNVVSNDTYTGVVTTTTQRLYGNIDACSRSSGNTANSVASVTTSDATALIGNNVFNWSSTNSSLLGGANTVVGGANNGWPGTGVGRANSCEGGANNGWPGTGVGRANSCEGGANNGWPGTGVGRADSCEGGAKMSAAELWLSSVSTLPNQQQTLSPLTSVTSDLTSLPYCSDLTSPLPSNNVNLSSIATGPLPSNHFTSLTHPNCSPVVTRRQYTNSQSPAATHRLPSNMSPMATRPLPSLPVKTFSNPFECPDVTRTFHMNM